MTPQQYRQILANRRRDWMGAPIGDSVGAIVRTADRAGRRRRMAQEAWERFAPAEMAREARVVEVSDGVVVIAAAGALREQIRRAAARLTRQLSDSVPGVRGLRVL